MDLTKDLNHLESSKAFTFWRNLFPELFGVDEKLICDWAVRTRSELSGSGDCELLGPAFSWGHLLVSDNFMTNPQYDFYEFQAEINKAIDKIGDCYDTKFNYNMAKQSIFDMLAGYHERFRSLAHNEFITRKEWHGKLSGIMKESYFAFWTGFLSSVLQWPENRMFQWHEQHKQAIESGLPNYYQNGPAYFIKHLAIPTTLIPKLDVDWFALSEKMYQAIDLDGACRRADYDFEAAKARLSTVYSEYGVEVSDQEIVDEKQELSIINAPYYLRFWHSILSKLLGWEDSTFWEWTHKFEDYLYGRVDSSFFFHDGAASYISGLFIPEPLLGNYEDYELRELEKSIENAIRAGGNEFSPVYNYAEAKSQINNLLSQYNHELPSVS